MQTVINHQQHLHLLLCTNKHSLVQYTHKHTRFHQNPPLFRPIDSNSMLYLLSLFLETKRNETSYNTLAVSSFARICSYTLGVLTQGKTRFLPMTSVRWMRYDLKLSYIHTKTAHSTTTNLSTLAVYTLIQVVEYTYDILVCNRRERVRERNRETENIRHIRTLGCEKGPQI